MSLALDKHRLISEFARMVNVPRITMKRRLMIAHKEAIRDGNPPVLVKLGDPGEKKRWYATLRTIQGAWPEVFHRHVANLDDVEDLQRKQRKSETDLARLEKQFRAFRAQAAAWFREHGPADHSGKGCAI